MPKAYLHGFQHKDVAYEIVVPVHPVERGEIFDWDWRDPYDQTQYGSRSSDILARFMMKKDYPMAVNIVGDEASYLVVLTGGEIGELKDYLDRMEAKYDIYEYRESGDVKWTKDLYGKGD